MLSAIQCRFTYQARTTRLNPKAPNYTKKEGCNKVPRRLLGRQLSLVWAVPGRKSGSGPSRDGMSRGWPGARGTWCRGRGLPGARGRGRGRALSGKMAAGATAPPTPRYLRVQEHDLIPRRFPQDTPHPQVRQRESGGGATFSGGPAIFLFLLLPLPLRLRALRHDSRPPPHCARAAPQGALRNVALWRLGGCEPSRLLLPQTPEPGIETKIRKTTEILKLLHFRSRNDSVQSHCLPPSCPAHSPAGALSA